SASSTPFSMSICLLGPLRASNAARTPQYTPNATTRLTTGTMIFTASGTFLRGGCGVGGTDAGAAVGGTDAVGGTGCAGAAGAAAVGSMGWPVPDVSVIRPPRLVVVPADGCRTSRARA